MIKLYNVTNGVGVLKKIYFIILASVLCFGTFSACAKSNTQDITTIATASTVTTTETASSLNANEALNAISSIKDVIINKTKYLCTEDNQFVYLNDPHSNNYLSINDNGLYEYTDGEDGKLYYVFTDFCVIDIDEDGNQEILLQSESSNIFLFHYENTVVYGYVFPFRGMLSLKKDCSFGASGGAAFNFAGKIRFLNGKCIFDELCLFNGLDDVYRINGKTVNQDDAKQYLDNLDKKEDAEWHVFNEINIEKYVQVD
jgi:hypothetical protein